jgi:hypothetical protein
MRTLKITKVARSPEMSGGVYAAAPPRQHLSSQQNNVEWPDTESPDACLQARNAFDHRSLSMAAAEMEMRRQQRAQTRRSLASEQHPSPSKEMANLLEQHPSTAILHR